jgi:plasmid maintenance system antidote protein VapI
MSEPFEPDWTLSPAVMLADILKARGMSPEQLAVRSGLGGLVMSILGPDQRRITAEISVRLGEALGISAQFFLNAQDIYDADLARGATDVSGRRHH